MSTLTIPAARTDDLVPKARAAQQATRRAVADERLRIARELHDVITHSMSLITVKASVANYLVESRPEEVRATLTLIEATGREALTEMRRMLGVLQASLRTNYYQRSAEGAPKEWLSIKLDPNLVPDAPLPRPMNDPELTSITVSASA